MENNQYEILDDIDDGILEETLGDENQYINILSFLDDKLIIESIKEQLQNPLLDNKKNYLDYFNNRIKFLKIKYEKYKDYLSKIKEIEFNFYSKFFKLIKNFMPFTFSKDLSLSDEILFITNYYNFIFLNYNENLITFFTNFIIENKKTLILNYDDKKKNVDTIAMKKINKNKNDAIILANINNIIFDTIEEELDYEYILNLIIKDDEYFLSNFIIKRFIINNQIVFLESNFKDLFFKPLKEREENYTSIITSVFDNIFNFVNKK